MEQVDQKLGDAFDVIDATQEQYLKRVGKIVWGDRESRMEFFRMLAANIADHAEFFRRPFTHRPIYKQARILDDLQHVMRIHGKQEFEKALNKLNYGRISSNGGPESTGPRHQESHNGGSLEQVQLQ